MSTTENVKVEVEENKGLIRMGSFEIEKPFISDNESVEETKENTVVDKKIPVATEYDSRYLTLKQVEVLQRVNL